MKFRTRSEGHLKTADSGEICVPQVDITADRPVSAVEPLDISDQNDQSFNSSLSIFDDSFTNSPDVSHPAYICCICVIVSSVYPRPLKT